MRIRIPRRGDEKAFTLIELIVGMAITGIIVSAIAGALIVALTTTDATATRLSESHDAQISSAYLANDVQSAKGVVLGSGGTCSGASTTLITFKYATVDAVYSCGVSNGETRVVRTFGSSSVVLAHFAAKDLPPTVSCSPNADCSGTVSSVVMVFTEATSSSDATAYTYTLVGSRRGYNSGGGGGSLPPDVTLLSTGSDSPLWVQGSCPDPGTSSACVIDSSLTALPISDVSTTGWTSIPSTPTTLWDKLSDQSDATGAVTSTQNKEAKVALTTNLTPPASGTFPLVELRAQAIGSGAAKLTLSLYDGATLLVSNQAQGINNLGSYDWQLSAAEANRIPVSAYAHLTLGLTLNGTNGINVYGVALDTALPAGLLTIQGSLYVNSQNPAAVRLTGKKNTNKITISPGDFRIWSPGACSGCSHTTVSCPNCTWIGERPWTSYSTSLPDPLRSLAAPDPSTLGTGGCAGATCTPGVYNNTLARSSNTTLSPGIYYLKQGISITGSSSLSCTAPCTGGVMLYIAGGSVTFAGSSVLNLTAPTSGIYTGIVIFQAHGDFSEVKITGNAGNGATNHLSGIVYVPDSTQVTLATGNAAFSATAIVAQNIKVSAPVCIGLPNLCP